MQDVGRTATDSERGREASSGGLPLLPPASGLIELVVLTALIVLVDRIVPDVEFSDIQPNPFWLPVLLLSLQYGTVSGLLAAGVALLVTVLSGLPQEGVGENHFNYALRVYTQPILWFAAAVILGQFRMRQISAKAALRKEVDELTVSRATLADYSVSLRERCDRLERERAGASYSPALHLLDHLNAIGDSSAALEDAFARLMTSAFPGSSASVFLCAESRLSLVAASGWPQEAHWQRELGVADPLYRAIVSEGVPVSVLVAGDEHRLGGQGLVAVPLRVAGRTSAVIGMVKLESCEPADLDTATPRALEAIASVLARRYAEPDVAAGNTGVPGSLAEVLEASRGRLLRPLRWLPRRGEPADAVSDAPGVQNISTKPKVVR